jgi:hypothetical protein
MALWALARRERLIILHRCCAEPNVPAAYWFVASFGRKQTMRWKISHHGHDSRQIDLLAVLALLVVIVSALRYFDSGPAPQTKAAFIEASQSVRW